MTSRDDDDVTGTGMTAVSARALAHVIDSHPELVECDLTALRALTAELLRTLEDWSPHEDGPSLEEVSRYWERARRLGVTNDA